MYRVHSPTKTVTNQRFDVATGIHDELASPRAKKDNDINAEFFKYSPFYVFLSHREYVVFHCVVVLWTLTCYLRSFHRGGVWL